MDTVIYYFIYIFLDAAETLWSLAPYVALGAAVGEALRFTRLTGLIVKVMKSTPGLSVIYAIILGMVSPLCTYGTVPLVMGLYEAGMPAAPMIVFLITSSMMNPQLFIMTWGGISLEFALVRVMTIAVFGAAVGTILLIVPESWFVNIRLSDGRKMRMENRCTLEPVFSWRRYFRNVFKSLEMVGFYIIIGVILGSMIEILVPGHVKQYFFEAGSIRAILLVSLISIPIYACGGGVIPFINSMIESGMSRGAAAAFFNVGAAARMPILMALASILRPVWVVLLVLALVIYSMIVGVVYS